MSETHLSHTSVLGIVKADTLEFLGNLKTK